MFLHFLSIFLSIQPSELAITISAFNLESNPFIGKFPPFFLNSTQQFNIINSLIRNYIILEFPKDQKTSFFNFSSIIIDDSVYNDVLHFMKDDAFFLVGVNGFNKRVKILDPSTQDPYIFNQFTITVSDQFSKKDPTFIVKEMDSVRLDKNSKVSFSFKLIISPFDYPPPEPNLFTFYLFLCGFASLFSAILFFFLIYSKGKSVNIIQFNAIWTLNKFYSIVTLLSSSGIIYIVIIPIFFIFFFRNSAKDFISLLILSFFGIFLSTFIRCHVYHCSIYSNIPIALLFQLVFLIPYIFSSIMNSFVFNSFVGLGFRNSVLLIVSIYFISTCLTIVSTIFSKSHIDCKVKSFTKRDKNYPFQLFGFIQNFVISFLLFLILKPLIDHLYSVFIDDYYIDPLFILSFWPLYIGLIMIISLLRLKKNLNGTNNLWQTNHLTLNLLIGLFAFLYIFADMINFVHQKETFISGLSFIISLSFAVVLVGMAISFFTNFLFTYFIFTPDNESPLDEGEIFIV